MDTVVAKILIGVDEKGYMYPDTTHRPDVCPVCRNRVKDVPNLDYRVKRKTCDFLVTYDHYFIVSRQFKDFCELNKYQNLEFTQLTYSKDFFIITVNNIFPLDYVRRKTKFINLRECCGNYDEIIGASPAFKREDYSLMSDDFIFRTEYRFASYAFKNYNIIIGMQTMQKLEKAKLKGLYYDNVFL